MNDSSYMSIDDPDYVPSKPVIEINQRIWDTIGLESRLESSAEPEIELKRILDIEYGKALIQVLTTNPDGSNKEGIKFGFTKEVIDALRSEYGDQITEAEYQRLGHNYGAVVSKGRGDRGIARIVHWATTPGHAGTLRGQLSKEALKKIIEN